MILDQFEEYFLYRRLEENEGRFADQVARCINRPDLQANFLISIREDAYARLGDAFRGHIGNVYGNFLHLEYLNSEQARDAIEKPIERTNALHPEVEEFGIESELVDAVLRQVRRRKFAEGDGDGSSTAWADANDTAEIETTYLQLVMKRLWEEETRAGSHMLQLETLGRLGGASHHHRYHDPSMAALTPDQQTGAASIFRFLVTRAGTKIALTARDLATPRPSRVAH